MFSKKINEAKVLILLDNFQVTLTSRINYFRSFRELCQLLKDLNFINIEVRTHYSFFHCYHKKTVKTKTRDKYFFSLSVHTPYKKLLKDVIIKYDIVISNLSTAVYESMCEGILFIPYMPDNFPAQTIDKVADRMWFSDLFPPISRNLEEIRKVLIGFMNSPSETYEKFLESIKVANLYKQEKTTLWEIVLNGRYPKN